MELMDVVRDDAVWCCFLKVSGRRFVSDVGNYEDFVIWGQILMRGMMGSIDDLFSCARGLWGSKCRAEFLYS